MESEKIIEQIAAAAYKHLSDPSVTLTHNHEQAAKTAIADAIRDAISSLPDGYVTTQTTVNVDGQDRILHCRHVVFNGLVFTVGTRVGEPVASLRPKDPPGEPSAPPASGDVLWVGMHPTDAFVAQGYLKNGEKRMIERDGDDSFSTEVRGCLARVSEAIRVARETEPKKTLPLRAELAEFASHMEKTLRANDHKVGFADSDLADVYVKLTSEFAEVATLFTRGPRDAGVKGWARLMLGECVDLANMAMFLARKARDYASDL